jgi:hypothetical protein
MWRLSATAIDGVPRLSHSSTRHGLSEVLKARIRPLGPLSFRAPINAAATHCGRFWVQQVPGVMREFPHISLVLPNKRKTSYLVITV